MCLGIQILGNVLDLSLFPLRSYTSSAHYFYSNSLWAQPDFTAQELCEKGKNENRVVRAKTILVVKKKRGEFV